MRIKQYLDNPKAVAAGHLTTEHSRHFANMNVVGTHRECSER